VSIAAARSAAVWKLLLLLLLLPVVLAGATRGTYKLASCVTSAMLIHWLNCLLQASNSH
jgi:hypothetical protein